MGCNNISISLELNFKKTTDLEGSVLIRCTQNTKYKRIGTYTYKKSRLPEATGTYLKPVKLFQDNFHPYPKYAFSAPL